MNDSNMVLITNEEYAELIRDKTLLEVIRRAYHHTDSYYMKDVIKGILGDDDYDKAEEAAKRG